MTLFPAVWRGTVLCTANIGVPPLVFGMALGYIIIFYIDTAAYYYTHYTPLNTLHYVHWSQYTLIEHTTVHIKSVSK